MRDNRLLKKVGEAIKHQRVAKGLTQKYLAEKAQISERTLSRAEQGKTELRIMAILKICKVLEITTSELIDH
jgi:transcriptional regulator with XRE-family HTH domain